MRWQPGMRKCTAKLNKVSHCSSKGPPTYSLETVDHMTANRGELRSHFLVRMSKNVHLYS